MLECFNIRRRTFGQHLDATVFEVLHIADHLMPRGRALRKETIADALHVASDKKLPSNARPIHWIEFYTEADCAPCEAVVIVGDWDKVKDQVTPLGDVTI